MRLSAFAERGVHIERVLTDNAWAYASSTYVPAVASLSGPSQADPSPRQQTDGKAERFIRTLLTDWACGRLYRTNEERLAALPGCVREYNIERTHTALGGITPDDGSPAMAGT